MFSKEMGIEELQSGPTITKCIDDIKLCRDGLSSPPLIIWSPVFALLILLLRLLVLLYCLICFGWKISGGILGLTKLG